MYLQEILEVAIGLVFMWLVVSVATMTLQEWIGNWLKWRAAGLEKNIQLMLNKTDLAKEVYKHPLIASLYTPGKNDKDKPRLPSYIPAGKFASAIFDVIVKAGTDESPVKKFSAEIDNQLLAMRSPEQQKLAQEDWNTILETAKHVASSGAGQSAVDSLKEKIKGYGSRYPELKDTLENVLVPQIDKYYEDFLDAQKTEEPDADLPMRQFRLGLKALAFVSGDDARNTEGLSVEEKKKREERKKLKETIEAIMRSAQITAEKGEAAVAKTRKEFEGWFNDSMDRLSGTYKRKAQLISFILGIGLALFLNVDSINLANSLWREPTLRQAIVAQAESYANTNQQAPGSTTDSSGAVVNPVQNIEGLQTQLQALNIPFGWTGEPVPYDTKVPCVPSALSKHDEKGNATQIMGVRIGDSCYPLVNTPPFNGSNILAWLTKLLGMSITGAAAAQGAPFWFDILKKLVNVRSSGVKPEEKEQKAVG